MSRLFPERRTVRLSGASAELAGVADLGRCRLTVILANELVRYLVVPWHDALNGEAEEQAYLRHHFAKVHGERAKGWTYRWSEGLASAVDSEMISGLKASKATIVSIQPELMAGFNRARKKSIPRAGAWLVQPGEGRACIALHVRGKWQSVQNARGIWEELLERERHRIGGDTPKEIVQLESIH